MFWSWAEIWSSVIAVWRQPRIADREHDADDRPAPAEDRDAAEQHDRDDEQLLPGARVVAGRGEAERPEDPGEAAEHAREDEEPELDPLHADAGEERGLVPGADREDRAPERRRVQDDADHEREDREEQDRPRDLRARDREHADVREGRSGRPPIVSVGRITWAMPRKSVSVPIVTASDGRPRPVTRKPLNAPHTAPTHERRAHREPDRPAVREQLRHHDAREAEHRGDREVDLAGDHDQRDRQRHDRDLADVERRCRRRARRQNAGETETP